MLSEHNGVWECTTDFTVLEMCKLGVGKCAVYGKFSLLFHNLLNAYVLKSKIFA